MRMWLALALLTSLMQQPDAETRIINYLQDNLEPGQRIIISDLVNDVFTTPEERIALDGLYNTFFKIPMFLVQFQTSSGRVPTLQEISEQFVFEVDGQADVMLRIMEADPRIPSFFERDPTTGELTSLDVEPIRDHPQFGRAIERTIAGWEGNAIPPFSIETFGGDSITSASLAGKAHMIYIWFTNCPPCVETAPLLVELYDQYRSAGFEIVAANADRLLELPYDDEVRHEYVEKLGIEFTTAYLSEEMQTALGGITVFPTMFFVDREGVIVRHFMNFQEKGVLDEAIRAALD